MCPNQSGHVLTDAEYPVIRKAKIISLVVARGLRAIHP
jgi:hypothetical protein